MQTHVLHVFSYTTANPVLVATQQVFREGSGDGLAEFAAEAGQVQHMERGFRSGESSEGGGLGDSRQVQQGSGEGSVEVFGEGQGGFVEPGQVQRGSGKASGRAQE